MTPDQIIEWAREAGLEEAVPGLFYASSNGLEWFAALVAAHEREQCALVCAEWPSGRWLAENIRARGEKS